MTDAYGGVRHGTGLEVSFAREGVTVVF
jgi:hypothetical protein